MLIQINAYQEEKTLTEVPLVTIYSHFCCDLTAALAAGAFEAAAAPLPPARMLGVLTSDVSAGLSLPSSGGVTCIALVLGSQIWCDSEAKTLAH